jgi:hypothetical protein
MTRRVMVRGGWRTLWTRCRTGAVAVTLVAGLVGSAAAQSESRANVVMTDVRPGAEIDLNVLGVKQATAHADATGAVSFSMDLLNLGKPRGFSGTAYLDTTPTGAVLYLVEDGAEPPPAAGERRRLGRFEVRPDRTVTFRAARPGTRAPVGGVMVGYTTDMSDLDITRKLEVEVVSVSTTPNGPFQPFMENRSTSVPSTLSVDGGINASGAQFVAPLPGGGGFAAAVGRAANAPLDGAAASGGGSRLVTHHAILSIGRAEAELDFYEADADFQTRWRGSGVHWGLGYGAMVELCGDCHWFLNGSYVYSRLPSTDITRSPIANVAQFGTLRRDGASFTWSAHTFEATVGRATRHVFPYVGLRTARREASFQGNLDIDYALPNGVRFEQRTAFEADFEQTTVQALVGAQVRVPRSSLFVRVEGAAGGRDSTRVGVNVGYGWYR